MQQRVSTFVISVIVFDLLVVIQPGSSYFAHVLSNLTTLQRTHCAIKYVTKHKQH